MYHFKIDFCKKVEFNKIVKIQDLPEVIILMKAKLFVLFTQHCLINQALPRLVRHRRAFPNAYRRLALHFL